MLGLRQHAECLQFSLTVLFTGFLPKPGNRVQLHLGIVCDQRRQAVLVIQPEDSVPVSGMHGQILSDQRAFADAAHAVQTARMACVCMQEKRQVRQFLFPAIEHGNRLERSGAQPGLGFIRQREDFLQLSDCLAVMLIPVAVIACQCLMEKRGQRAIQSILEVTAGIGHVRKIENSIRFAVKSGRRAMKERMKQNRAETVQVRVNAQPVQPACLLLQRRKAFGIGSAQGCRIMGLNRGLQFLL